MRHVYLDYNTTTPVAPAVRDAMWSFLGDHYGSPASSYALGRATQEAVEDAREQVGALIGADREEIVFTSGGTESNNFALKGILLRQAIELGGHLVVSNIEHGAVMEPARFLERLGYELTIVPVDSQGCVSPQAVAEALRPNTLLVSVMHANHEVGAIQPIAEIAELCRARGIPLHTDATQSAGKIRVNVDELGVDLLSLSAHKMYGPKGVGALFIRGGMRLEPLIHGIGHEGGLRGGMENVPGIMGMGRAASLAAKMLDEIQPRMTELSERLLNQLRDGIGDELRVQGDLAPRLPNTLSVNFPGVNAAKLLQLAPEVAAWTAASPYDDLSGASPTLDAMKVRPEHSVGTVRLSVGWYTAEDEIDFAASRLLDAWERLK
jgi:cysteine desulfurase